MRRSNFQRNPRGKKWKTRKSRRNYIKTICTSGSYCMLRPNRAFRLLSLICAHRLIQAERNRSLSETKTHITNSQETKLFLLSLGLLTWHCKFRPHKHSTYAHGPAPNLTKQHHAAVPLRQSTSAEISGKNTKTLGWTILWGREASCTANVSSGRPLSLGYSDRNQRITHFKNQLWVHGFHNQEDVAPQK